MAPDAAALHRHTARLAVALRKAEREGLTEPLLSPLRPAVRAAAEAVRAARLAAANSPAPAARTRAAPDRLAGAFPILAALAGAEVMGRSSAAQAETDELRAKEVFEGKDDLEDTKETLDQDEKFKAELETDCAADTEGFEDTKATRAEEPAAAAELLEKTLPSAGSSSQQLAESSGEGEEAEEE